MRTGKETRPFARAEADPLSSPCKEDILVKKPKLGSERNRKKEGRGKEGGRKWNTENGMGV